MEHIRTLIAWPTLPSREWTAGFLAGLFDAEGSCSDGILRISNTDAEIIGWLTRSLDSLDFRHVVEHVSGERLKPIDVVRVTGGLR